MIFPPKTNNNTITMSPAEIFPQVYDELRRLAAVKMQNEAEGHTLNTTALVNEVWLKLNGESFASKSGFFRASAVAMRRILVDHARAKKAAKRGAHQRVERDMNALPQIDPMEELEALDEALGRLAVVQPKVAELVELRYFVGMTIPEAAALLDISSRTADAWWAYARGWLAEELKKS